VHNGDSKELIKKLMEKTANAISDDRLRLLFVSVQQNNMDLSIFCAVDSVFRLASNNDLQAVEASLAYFPHSWKDAKYDKERDLYLNCDCYLNCYLDHLLENLTFRTNVAAFKTSLQTRYPGILNSMERPSGCAAVVAALCICAEQTFTQSASTLAAFGPACSIALDAYLGSDLERDVKTEIARIPPQDYPKVTEKDRHRTKNIVPKLVEIIKTHRLRIKI